MTHITASNSTTATWNCWNDTGTATSVIDTTWGCWANSTVTTTATTAGSATTWMQWMSDGTTSGTYVVTQPAQLSKEQLAVVKQQQAEFNKAQAELQAKQKHAKAKAEQLLVEHLTEEQEKAWKENRAIFVTAKSGRRFKIREGRAGNIEEINAEGKAIRSFCVHVEPYNVPDADNVLAQKLALEHNEEALLRVANSHPITPYR